MSLTSNLDLLAVGIAIAAIGILGFIVFFNDRKSFTNQTFFVFTLVAIAWNSVNYLAYQFHSLIFVLWSLRLVLFFAVWYCFNLFQLFYVFPKDNFSLPPGYKKFLVPIVSLVSLITLTPLAIMKVNNLPGQASSIPDKLGPGMILFGLTVLSLIVGGVVIFIKKMRSPEVSLKAPYRYILIGTCISFSLYIIFNLVLPAVFNNIRYIPDGAVFTFPLIAFTSYAIIKHRLFNVKVLSTELLVFVIAIVTLFEVVTASGFVAILLRSSEFVLVLCFGILLIKSVINEVKQRQQLEKLSEQLEQANQQLKTLDQARADFISIASHQLRTPPATVKWYLSALMSGDYGPTPQQWLGPMKTVVQTNNHLISLIEDMLNVSRIERGKMEFLFEPVDVEELARFAYEQLIPPAHDKKLNLEYRPPPKPLPLVTADKEKLRQVMNNLIDNAIKYTKQGNVTVKIFQDGDNVRFEVNDTGKGISQQDAAAIFQKYSRGKESIKQSAGLGLGLYVAKIIIDQHQGKIWAESLGEGRGSAFIFTLPVHNNLKTTTLVDLAQS